MNPLVVDIFTSAAALATIAAAVFVGYQAFLARKDFQARNKRATVEKTSELIQFYIDTILPYTGYIGTVAKLIGIKDIRDTINPQKLVDFNTTEMKCLLSDEQIKTYGALFSGELPENHLHQARYALRHVAATKNFKKQIVNMLPSLVPKKVENYEVNAEFMHIANAMMSNLEYFCMCFNEGIADDKLAYSSINQTFFPLVMTFYVRIAQLNTDSDKQHYTQISKMYVRWINMQ